MISRILPFEKYVITLYGMHVYFCTHPQYRPSYEDQLRTNGTQKLPRKSKKYLFLRHYRDMTIIEYEL